MKKHSGLSVKFFNTLVWTELNGSECTKRGYFELDYVFTTRAKKPNLRRIYQA